MPAQERGLPTRAPVAGVEVPAAQVGLDLGRDQPGQIPTLFDQPADVRGLDVRRRDVAEHHPPGVDAGRSQGRLSQAVKSSAIPLFAVSAGQR